MIERSRNVTGTVIRWLSANWSGVTDSYVRPPGALCADCSSDAGRITLLTAWTAYYTCSVCHRRWSRARHAEGAH
jgi:hypothetical protein